MKIVKRQKDLIDIIKDKRVKEVFEFAANLEDASDKVCWNIFLKHADKFGSDPLEIVESTEESYFLDNEMFVEFLNKYYSGKKINFDVSPDGERIYLNNVEVDVIGTPDSNYNLIVQRYIDTYVTNIGEYNGNFDLYKKLVDAIPFIDWDYTRAKGITVDLEGKFKEFDSRVVPFVSDGEVELREVLNLDTSLTDKWIVNIAHFPLGECCCCDRCEDFCD